MSDTSTGAYAASRHELARRRARMMWLTGTVLLLATVLVALASHREGASTSFLAGMVTGIVCVFLVVGLVLWLSRRRGGNYLARMVEGDLDERDRLIWKHAWAFTGLVSQVYVLGVVVAGLLDVSARLSVLGSALVWVNAAALSGALLYCERTM